MECDSPVKKIAFNKKNKTHLSFTASVVGWDFYNRPPPFCSNAAFAANCFIGSLGAVLVQHLDASTTLGELPHDGLHLGPFCRFLFRRNGSFFPQDSNGEIVCWSVGWGAFLWNLLKRSYVNTKKAFLERQVSYFFWQLYPLNQQLLA